jgi:hypothetical protein
MCMKVIIGTIKKKCEIDMYKILYSLTLSLFCWFNFAHPGFSKLIIETNDDKMWNIRGQYIGYPHNDVVTDSNMWLTLRYLSTSYETVIRYQLNHY